MLSTVVHMRSAPDAGTVGDSPRSVCAIVIASPARDQVLSCEQLAQASSAARFSFHEISEVPVAAPTGLGASASGGIRQREAIRPPPVDEDLHIGSRCLGLRAKPAPGSCRRSDLRML
ncbi:MAG: hypothetical protein ACRDLT_11370 [Solirubrobacteraceae bacterium]